MSLKSLGSLRKIPITPITPIIPITPQPPTTLVRSQPPHNPYKCSSIEKGLRPKSCMAEEILGFGITDAFLFLPLTIPTLTTLKRRMAEEILGFVQ